MSNDKKEKSQNLGKTCKCNEGIACDVTNCAYHDGKCTCTAERISVGPSFASSCTDTVCATFRQKTF